MNKKEKLSIYADFLNLCGEILSGKAEKEDIEKLTEAMVKSGQRDLMKKELKDISKIIIAKRKRENND